MSKTGHGKINEGYINNALNLDDLTTIDPLSPYDAYGPSIFKKEKWYYQTKCIRKGGSICLGDLYRNFTHTEPFILISTFYNGSLRGKVFSEETPLHTIRAYLIDDRSKWNSWCRFDQCQEYTQKMKDLGNEHSKDYLWKIMLKEIKSKYYLDKPDTIISINPKRDSGTQNRIQCSISYKRFMTILPEHYQYVDFANYEELKKSI